MPVTTSQLGFSHKNGWPIKIVSQNCKLFQISSQLYPNNLCFLVRFVHQRNNWEFSFSRGSDHNYQAAQVHGAVWTNLYQYLRFDCIKNYPNSPNVGTSGTLFKWYVALAMLWKPVDTSWSSFYAPRLRAPSARRSAKSEERIAAMHWAAV